MNKKAGVGCTGATALGALKPPVGESYRQPGPTKISYKCI